MPMVQVFIQKLNKFFATVNESWLLYLLLVIGFYTVYYYAFKVLKQNKGGSIITIFISAIILFGVSFSVSDSIGSEMLLMVFFLFVLFIFSMFNVEIKRGMLDKGARNKVKRDDLSVSRVERIIENTVQAVLNMSKNNIGALIVLSNSNLPESILLSGTEINAEITSTMIEAVFYPKAPLHDGAMIIEDDKIRAAGCFLPLMQNDALPQEVGSRHRAAISVTIVASVTAIVVSEETGIISIIRNGVIFKKYATAADLKSALSSYYWSDLAMED